MPEGANSFQAIQLANGQYICSPEQGFARNMPVYEQQVS